VAQVTALIESGRALDPVRVRFTEVSIELLANALDFLTASHIEWIDRPYKPKLGSGAMIWSGYSVDALRHNIRKILIASLDNYRLLVERNQIPELLT
jgi:hypothetical protein